MLLIAALKSEWMKVIAWIFKQWDIFRVKTQKFSKTCSLGFSEILLENFDYSMPYSRNGGHGCNIPLKGKKIVKRGHFLPK